MPSVALSDRSLNIKLFIAYIFELLAFIPPALKASVYWFPSKVNTPVIVSPVLLILLFKAVCCAVDIGLSLSDVLFTLPNPTFAFVIFTFPV